MWRSVAIPQRKWMLECLRGKHTPRQQQAVPKIEFHGRLPTILPTLLAMMDNGMAATPAPAPLRSQTVRFTPFPNFVTASSLGTVFCNTNRRNRVVGCTVCLAYWKGAIDGRWGSATGWQSSGCGCAGCPSSYVADSAAAFAREKGMQRMALAGNPRSLIAVKPAKLRRSMTVPRRR